MEHNLTINGLGVFAEHKCNADEHAEASSDSFVKAVKTLVGKLSLDAYGRQYADALDESFTMGGARGVACQVGYILCNAKAKTPEGKEARKTLDAMQKAYYAKDNAKLNKLIAKAQQ